VSRCEASRPSLAPPRRRPRASKVIACDGRTLMTMNRYHCRGKPPDVRHQGARNGTALHQLPQVPDSGDFLPNFLPKQAASRSRDVIFPGHNRELERPARMCYQPSKLAMRVRFPSPVPDHCYLSIYYSHYSCFASSTCRRDCQLRYFLYLARFFELSYVNVRGW
jgi:hypothetical protein